MASDVITCIGSVVDDLQFLVDAGVAHLDSAVKLLIFKLRNIRIFLLSAEDLGDDPSFGSLLLVMEDYVRQIAKRFHTVRLFLLGEATSEQFDSDVNDPDLEAGLVEDFSSWDERINLFYVALLNPLRESISLTADAVVDIILSVLENLEAFHSLESELCSEILGEPMKAMGDQLIFLINLAAFVPGGVDSGAHNDLIAHIEFVYLNAGFLLFWCDPDRCSESNCGDMILGISMLIQYIKPIDPQVCKTYTEALSTSKLRRRYLASADQDMGDEYNSAKEFIDSLMSNLLEILQLDTHDVVSMKDQLQQLYDRLGSLTAILSQKPNKLDSNAIFDVVCDAGVLICSLYQAHIQLDQDLQDLLEAIKIIMSEFGEKAAPEPMFNKVPITAPLSFVDFLLEELTELASGEVETDTRRHAQALKEELVALRSFLGDIIDLRHEREELQTVWDHIMELVYKIEHLIDYLMVGDLSGSYLTPFDSIMKGIHRIKMEIEVLKSEISLKGETMTPGHVPCQKPLSLENEVVGYLGEAEAIKNRLTRGSKQLSIVAIVGMPGQGKTTLATKVYNDRSILCHFSVCVRTTVSQIMEKRRILFEILNQIDPDKCSGITSDHDLVQKVWRSLRGRKYLIFLDDIWEAEALSSLKEAFPEDHAASRIMLTSRNHDVASSAELYELRPFNEEESMDLLQRKLFNGGGWPTELVDLGMQKIAEICKGLPLTILIVAGVLATTEPGGWKKILGGFISGTISSTEQCRNTLELSYKNLPEHLRPCFLYLATFPENEEVPIRRLIHLWIAEGFVRKDGARHVEDVAENYLKDLIGRSLLMVAQQKSIGGVKACRIHDLLHEFCFEKAKEEQFFSILGGNEVSAFHAPHNPRRLCVNSDPKHLIRLSNYFSNVRSLRFNYYLNRVPRNLSFLINSCKLLSVLDLGHINLGSVFPTEIGNLVQLAFLAIKGCMRDISPSIGNLSKLETFILNRITEKKTISFPESFWNLQKLRHLYVTSPGGALPMENLGRSSNLCLLDWLSGVAIPYQANMKGLMKKFPNVRKLKCILWDFHDEIGDHIKIVVPDFLSQLQSLGMSLFNTVKEPEGIKFEFSLPANLKKLTLFRFHLSSGGLSTISKLPNLEVLKLKAVIFERDIWEMEEEKFPKLRYLLLSSWKLLSWSGSEDHFECLEMLVLMSCGFLKEIPSCLEDISTLEVIHVMLCSETVVELVGKIQQAQEENGNSELKIITP